MALHLLFAALGFYSVAANPAQGDVGGSESQELQAGTGSHPYSVPEEVQADTSAEAPTSTEGMQMQPSRLRGMEIYGKGRHGME